jgi:hypothetical protein
MMFASHAIRRAVSPEIGVPSESRATPSAETWPSNV